MSSSSQYEPALKRMAKLVNSFMARADAGPFLEPVDWRGLELFDYPKIIKKMMDLGTIKRKLERKQYKTAHQCAEDIRLVWTNCLTYNMEGSDFWLLAKSFSKRFEDRYKKIQAEFDTGEDLESAGAGTSEAGVAASSSSKKSSASPKTVAPSLDTKMTFSSNIYLLSGMEFGHVMQQIDLKCPDALEHLGGEKCEINVDKLDSKTLMELDRYVREKVGSRHASTNETSERPSKRRKK